MVNGRLLRWRNMTFAANQSRTITLVLVVGSGVGEGEYTNRAWALNNLVNTAVSNVGSATVRPRARSDLRLHGHHRQGLR